MSCRDRSGAEDGVGVRAGRGRGKDRSAGLEAAEGPFRELAGSARGGDSEAVERPAVRVVRSDQVGEAAADSGRAAVVKAAVGPLRPLEEGEVDRSERGRRRGSVRLANNRGERTCDVVCAVAVLGPGRTVVRVLEETYRVRERGEVRERRSRENQSALAAPAVIALRVTCR
jgi:hypothetical protein